MRNSSSQGRNRQRPNVGLRSRLTLRTIVLVSGVLLAVGALFTILTLNLSTPNKSWGAAVGDYQSVSSGDWTSTSTWARWNGTTWVTPAPTAPTAADGTINIQNGHVVSLSATAAGADQLTIDAGGTLDLRGSTFTLANGTGTDMTVNGTLKNAATLTLGASANISFGSGSNYQHAFTTTAGTIPLATWNVNSTCEIIGYTSNTTSPTNIGQTFGNLTWNCPSQTGIVLWSALPTVAGNFSVMSTGTSQLQLANAAATINVAGSYNQTGGTVNFNSANSKNTNLNVGGNWNHTGGTILCSSNSTAGIYFNKTGVQTYTASGNTVTGNIDFFVNAGSTLDVGTSVVLGRDFNLPAGAAMIIGSPSGIQAVGNASGNVQSSRTRNYNAAADYTFNGSAAQQTGAGFPAQARNITFSNTNGVTLTGSVTVTGTLSLDNGIVSTGVNTLILGTSATATGTLSRNTGYVSGNLRRWIASGTSNNMLFPVGTSAYYNGAEFDFTSVTTGGTIQATFNSVKPDAAGLPLTDAGDNCMNIGYGYWQVNAANGFTGGTYNARLSPVGMPGISNPAGLHVAQRSATGQSWTGNGTHQSGSGTVQSPLVSRTGMTSLGQLAIVSGSSNVLPIELLYFRARWVGGKVELTWATGSEVNNDHFTIERSMDGEHFQSVVELRGNGNSSQTISYSTMDRQPLIGRSYYRLKQTDFDGTYTYSDVRSVISPSRISTTAALEITAVFPNPCTDQINVAYRSADGKPVRVMLFNSEGKMMHDDEWESTPDQLSSETIETQSMPSGTYFVYLVSGEERISKRIIHR